MKKRPFKSFKQFKLFKSRPEIQRSAAFPTRDDNADKNVRAPLFVLFERLERFKPLERVRPYTWGSSISNPSYRSMRYSFPSLSWKTSLLMTTFCPLPGIGI
jgi:hypothetical protein